MDEAVHQLLAKVVLAQLFRVITVSVAVRKSRLELNCLFLSPTMRTLQVRVILQACADCQVFVCFCCRSDVCVFSRGTKSGHQNYQTVSGQGMNNDKVIEGCRSMGMCIVNPLPNKRYV